MSCWQGFHDEPSMKLHFFRAQLFSHHCHALFYFIHQKYEHGDDVLLGEYPMIIRF
jgi:hypothetical protein